MLKENNILITLTGPSGSGKSTIERMLVDKYGIKRAISHTSREPRMSEQNGVDYYFVGKEILMTMFNEGKLAEFIEYNGNLYGVSVDEILKSQVIVIEPHGLKQVKEKMKDKKHIISVYLNIDEDTMKQRMKQRGESLEKIELRIKNDKEHFSNINYNDYDVVIHTMGTKPLVIVNAIFDICKNLINVSNINNMEL